MNKIYSALLLTLTIYSCNQTDNKQVPNSVNMDSGYTIIKTNKLFTASATKPYSTKNRKATQFALDKDSRQEKTENFIIKISDKAILVCDVNNNILKDLSIIKQWIDKSGPSTVYDLRDKNGVEYSLDHYIDYQKKNFLGFRFSNSLETYSNE